MKKFLLVCFSLVFIVSTTALAQDRVISGKVTSGEDGTSLPGVNIVLKGTTNGAVSDADGQFKISIPSSGGVLVFSFIGFLTQEVDVGDRTVIDVTMGSDVTQLSEVVVTSAGGIQSRVRELGSAVNIMTPETLTAGRAINVAQGLQGKVAGVAINGTGSGPNPDFRVVMRGQRSLTGDNTALIVLDNVIVPSSVLGTLNQNDIESINILNGAGAAALYGSQASNGAMIITTKKGTKGRTDINVSHNVQVNQVAFLPKIQKQFGSGGSAYGTDPSGVGAFNYLENQSYGAPFDGSLRPLGPKLEDGTQLYTPYSYKNGHDKFWVNGVSNQTDFSISTADEKGSLYLSAQYVTVGGTTPGDTYKRGNIRVNGTRKVNDKLTINYNTLYAPKSSDITTQTAAIYDNMLNMPSNVDITTFKDWQNNKFATPAGFYNPWYNNPYFSAANWRKKEKENNLQGNIELKFTPLKGLEITAREGVTTTITETKTWNGAYKMSDYAKNTDQSSKVDIPANLNESNLRETQLVTDFLAQYNKTMGDINLNIVAGTQLKQNTGRGMSTGIGGLVVNGLNNLSNGTGNPSYGEGEYTTRLMGVYGQAVVGWKDVLFITGSGRNDWDSRLNKNNRSFFYPRGEVAFLLSEALPAIKSSNLISYFKIRGGVSKTGLVNLGTSGGNGAYQTVPTFSSNVSYQTSNGFPYGSLAGYSRGNGLVSNDLKPELTHSYEFGFDLNLWRDRVVSNVTYYHSVTDNQVVTTSVSNSTGFNTLLTNAGITTNYGIESALHVTPIKNNNWTITVGGNFTYLVNKVNKITDDLPLLALATSGTAVSAAVEGQPFPVIMGLDYNRDPQGRVIVDAVTGVPTSTTSNVILGNAQPKYRAGADFVATYKSIRLSFLFEYRGGYKIYNGLSGSTDWSGTGWRTAVYGRTSFIFPNSVYLSNDGTTYVENTSVAIANGNGNNGFWSDGINRNTTSNYVTSGDYIKLREVSISYEVPSAFISKIGGKVLKGITISAQGRNLLLWMAKDNYYTDPDYSAAGSTNNGIGLNNQNQTPPTRAFGGTLGFRF